jgi:Protein of unknown function (DUF1580)
MSQIDLAAEQLLSLAHAAHKLPAGRSGAPVSPSCLFRWIRDGVKTPDGNVRLEAIRMGGRWLTSVEALKRFAARQTPDMNQEPEFPRSAAARRRESERAARRLDAIGI